MSIVTGLAYFSNISGSGSLLFTSQSAFVLFFNNCRSDRCEMNSHGCFYLHFSHGGWHCTSFPEFFGYLYFIFLNFLDFIYFCFMYECLTELYLCTTCVQCPRRPEEGTGVTDCWDTMWSQELEPCPPEKEPELLASQLSLQHPVLHLLRISWSFISVANFYWLSVY